LVAGQDEGTPAVPTGAQLEEHASEIVLVPLGAVAKLVDDEQPTARISSSTRTQLSSSVSTSALRICARASV
jgi:hypothetical protein